MADAQGQGQGQGSMQFRTDWVYDIAQLPKPVNHFLLQVGLPVVSGEPSDEVYITFGHANPPVIINKGGGEVQIIAGDDPGKLPVTVVGHFSLTRTRVLELRQLLDNWLDADLRATVVDADE